MKYCEYPLCGKPLPENSRKDKRHCNRDCASLHNKLRKREGEEIRQYDCYVMRQEWRKGTIDQIPPMPSMIELVNLMRAGMSKIRMNV